MTTPERLNKELNQIKALAYYLTNDIENFTLSFSRNNNENDLDIEKYDRIIWACELIESMIGNALYTVQEIAENNGGII